jgi:hypothetical protein
MRAALTTNTGLSTDKSGYTAQSSVFSSRKKHDDRPRGQTYLLVVKKLVKMNSVSLRRHYPDQVQWV